MKKRLFTVLSILWTLGTMIGQTDIYVSAYTGFDSGTGDSWSSPYRTIDAALDKVTELGPDSYVIHVAQGEYIFEDNDAILDATPGMSGEPDEYRFYGIGYDITIKGGYATPTSDGAEPAFNKSIYKAVFIANGNDVTDSAFRIMNDSDAKIRLENLTIAKSDQGGNTNGSFLTIQRAVNASFSMDNVNVLEWKGGDGEGGRGFIYVFTSTNIAIDIKNSLVQRTFNRDGAGQFVRVNNNSRNIDVHVDNSVFRNLRGIGTNSSLFLINLNCDPDGGESSLIIENSEFYNNKRGLAAGQSAPVIKAVGLPLLRLLNNKFQGNAGGNGGVLQFVDSGELYSEGNLYQENYAGQSGGAIFINSSYDCGFAGISNEVTFKNDEFYGNHAGLDGLGGRGGAIFIAAEIGGSGALANKTVLIENSKFYDNYTTAFDGGAVLINTNKDATITGSIFCNNEANRNFTGNSAGNGGAVSATGTGHLYISDSHFIANISNQNGGAVYSTKDYVTINSCSYFDQNVADNQGGAVNTYGTKITTVDQTYFNGNISEGFGGALRVDSSGEITNVTNSDFIGNTADGTGGAIRVNTSLKLTNINFENNKSLNSSGGAVYINSAELSDFDNVNFDGNQAKLDGGALVAYNSNPASNNAVITINDSYFTNNSANQDGGAIRFDDYNTTIDNLVFDNNIAGRNGGAMTNEGSSAHTSVFTNSKFYNNIASQDGGAMRLEQYVAGTTDITYNEFVNNKADRRGGAIAVYDNGARSAGAEVDQMTYNTFFGNKVANDATITDIARRSDIYLQNGAGLYTAIISNLDHNALQFEPTTANYPNGSFGTGYRLGANNTLAANVVANYTPYVNNIPVCEIEGCPDPDPVPPLPLIASANGRNTNNPIDYTSYTPVDVNPSCEASITEVAFSARSNEAPSGGNGDILPSPIPHLIFTYKIVAADNITGVVTTTTGHVMDYATATDPSTNNRHEDYSEEIPASEGSGENARSRDIYHTYFLDVTDDLKPGYTYSYVITSISIVNDEIDATQTVTFNYDQQAPNDPIYQTTIITDFCDSDEDGIPNYVESPDGQADPSQEDEDGDGVPDYLDPDAPDFVDENGDGVDDNYDTDGDGQPDFLDIDTDNDGILDSVEAVGPQNSDPAQPADTDGDGVPDYRDLDSDNDSINDVDEGNPDAQDLDGDGMVEGPYGSNGLADSLESDDTFQATVSDPTNSDCADPNDTDNPCDDLPDYRDLDSDDDGVFDIVDQTPYGDGSTIPQSQDPTADPDGDGTVDTVKDSDADGIPDSVDVDNTGGTDSDGNGVDDNYDTTGNPNSPDMDGDGILDEHDPDKDGDGIADVVDNNPNEFGERLYCEIEPNNGIAGRTTHVGISTLDRNVEEWLPTNNNMGAYIVLESKDKGFVIPRYSSTADILAIGGEADGVEEGMIVWDNEENCLKMFYDHDENINTPKVWRCISNNECTNTKP